MQTLKGLKNSTSIVVDISEMLAESLDRTPSFSGHIPYSKYHLLFWCVESLHAVPDIKIDKKRTIGTIALSLQQSYLRILADMVHGQGYGVEEQDAFFTLGWPLVFRYFSEKQRSEFVSAVDLTGIQPDLSDYSFSLAIRTHFRLLLCLYGDQNIKEGGWTKEIEEQLAGFVVEYGFPNGATLGIFCHIHEKGLNLWSLFTESLNQFDPTDRSELIDQLLELNIPLVSLMELEHYLVIPADKARLLKAIQRRKIKEDEISWVPEIEKGIQLSLVQKSYSLANSLIEFGKKRANPVHKDLWQMLEFRSMLHQIHDNDNESIEDRVQRITDLPIPDFSNRSQADPRNSYQRKAERAKRFFTALLFFEQDPEKAYMWLDQLCKEFLNSLYRLNRLSAKMKILDQHDASSDEYLNVVNDWLEERKNILGEKFSEFESLISLIALSKGNDPVAFHLVWSKVPEVYRIKIEIVEASCESMKKYGLLKEAFDLINRARSHYGDRAEEVQKLDEIARNIGKKIALDKNIHPSFLVQNEGLTVAKTRAVWNEMRRFDQEAQAQIFHNRYEQNQALQTFLLDQVLTVCNELLLRAQNLKRIITGNQRLQIENLINDWFVSLSRSQFLLIGWTVSEGDRSGKSETGKDLGISDIRLFDSNGIPSLLCEAFLQENYSSRVIEKHIHKLAGYNSQGVGIIFVLVYCLSDDFNMLCDKYVAVLNGLTYNGFDTKKTKNKIDEISPVRCANVRIRVFKEVLCMNANPISICHVLIDFS
ncbi:hypothetical protein [Desulfobacter curvatus]|uniref:hypothetical protein n=1 Tax=Desulfobacter curvatus TaxID=2290 RepID=UPI000362B5A4|nr:hypothetical protein [Desulfobacter curvatus]